MTIIVSTHRPSLLSLVNRILVFDRGKLVADGPREAILATLQATARRKTEPVKFEPPAMKSNAAV
jgi:ATP-binding cassette subfamily C protein LapB